jgi:hypothetical protein
VAPSIAAAPATLADRVTGQIAALQGLAANYGATMPGVQASFGIGKTGNLTFSKTSARPLAVGFVGRVQYTMGELMKTIRTDIVGSDLGDDATPPAARRTLEDHAGQVAKTCAYYNVSGTALQTYLLDPNPGTAPKTLSRGAVRHQRAMN